MTDAQAMGLAGAFAGIVSGIGWGVWLGMHVMDRAYRKALGWDVDDEPPPRKRITLGRR